MKPISTVAAVLLVTFLSGAVFTDVAQQGAVEPYSRSNELWKAGKRPEVRGKYRSANNLEL